MKTLIIRVISILVILFCYSTLIQAVTPTSTVVMIENDIHTTISNSNALDTLSATDTTILIEDFIPTQGYEHSLMMAALTGTGADSVVSMILIQSKDNNNVVIKTDSITINSAVGAQSFVEHIIPLDGTKGSSPANKFRISFVTLTNSGGQIIVNKCWIRRRRSLSPRMLNDH